MSNLISNFIQNFLPQAEDVSVSTGLPVDYVLGQAGLESDWGTSNAAVNDRNYFGISPGGSLASYPNSAVGFNAYANLVNQGYSGSYLLGDPQSIAQSMADSGYSTDPNYATKVASAVQSVDAADPSLADWTGGAPGKRLPTKPNPKGWVAELEAWVTGIFDKSGPYVERGALIVLGLTLLMGALYLFGARETGAAPLPVPV